MTTQIEYETVTFPVPPGMTKSEFVAALTRDTPDSATPKTDTVYLGFGYKVSRDLLTNPGTVEAFAEAAAENYRDDILSAAERVQADDLLRHV